MFTKILKFIANATDDSRFVIQITGGTIQVTKGSVPPRFLADLRELASSSGLDSGTIRGKRQETHIRLVFSPNIPRELHQRLRNIWHFHEPTSQTGLP